jgi:hypothetical protein
MAIAKSPRNVTFSVVRVIDTRAICITGRSVASAPLGDHTQGIVDDVGAVPERAQGVAIPRHDGTHFKLFQAADFLFNRGRLRATVEFCGSAANATAASAPRTSATQRTERVSLKEKFIAYLLTNRSTRITSSAAGES